MRPAVAAVARRATTEGEAAHGELAQLTPEKAAELQALRKPEEALVAHPRTWVEAGAAVRRQTLMLRAHYWRTEQTQPRSRYWAAELVTRRGAPRLA